MNLKKFFILMMRNEQGIFRALFSVFRKNRQGESMVAKQARIRRAEEARKEHARQKPLHEKRKKELTGRKALGKSGSVIAGAQSQGAAPAAPASIIEQESLLNPKKDKKTSLISGL